MTVEAFAKTLTGIDSVYEHTRLLSARGISQKVTSLASFFYHS